MELTPQELAKAYHEAYERLKPEFSCYEYPIKWEEMHEKDIRFMVAVCEDVMGPIIAKLATAEASISAAFEACAIVMDQFDSAGIVTYRIGSQVSIAEEFRAMMPAAAIQLQERSIAEAQKPLYDALKILYEETADYITINNLGDVHHNRSMQGARDALRAAAPAPSEKGI